MFIDVTIDYSSEEFNPRVPFTLLRAQQKGLYTLTFGAHPGMGEGIPGGFVRGTIIFAH